MSADQLETWLTLLLLSLIGGGGVLLVVPRPRLALGLFLGGLVFVPVWLGGAFSGLLHVHLVLTILALAAIVLARFRNDPAAESVGLEPPGMGKLHPFDLVLLALAGLITVTHVFGGVDRGQVYLIATWGLLYALGRLAVREVGLPWIATVLSVMMAVVAGFAVLEWATSWNPWLQFTGNSSNAFRVWGPQQLRGSSVRAEAAFGHSIALGACLASTIVLTVCSRLSSRWKLVIIGLLCLALLVTFSRTAFVTAALGLVLLLTLSRWKLSRSMRIGLLTILTVGTVLGVLLTTGAFAEDEGVSSDAALYRVWLWDLFDGLNPLGASNLLYRTTDGTATAGSFASIDSAVLLYALSNGWIPAIILCLALAAAAVRLLVKGGDPALTALVAQAPAFFTVALITQYAYLVWFVVGMAVTGIHQAADKAVPQQPTPTVDRQPSAPVA